MKRYILDFMRRGVTACGFGPLILAVIYLILRQNGIVQMLTVEEVCLGIFTLSALAFIAGGMNILYQIERLPLMVAILIHGGVLYISYLGTYLINGWLMQGVKPILVFTVIFVLGYIGVWAVIFFITKKRTERVNAILKEKQKQKHECGNIRVVFRKRGKESSVF